MESHDFASAIPLKNNSPQVSLAKNQTVSFVVYDGIEIIDLTGPMDVFAIASTVLQESGVAQSPAYSIQVVAAEPGPVTASCGLDIIADCAYGDIQDGIDTLMIVGTPEVDCLLCDPALQEWVRSIAPKVKRMASVCTGAFLLAECGLLDGLRATSHWDWCDKLSRDYPLVHVEPDRIFVRDGSISTSGGITSGIDLALSMVEEDWGCEVALTVARYLVVFLKRPGGQTQFSVYLTSESSRPDIKELKSWIMLNLAEDLRIEKLAKRMSMSSRNFSRLFSAESGMTPARYVELARVDAARHYLSSTRFSIQEIAEKTGFFDTERMRRSFLRQLGINAHDYRKRFSVSGGDNHAVQDNLEEEGV